MLDLLESTLKREKAIRQVCMEPYFNDPLVTFVMTKTINQKEKMMIGVNEEGADLIYFPESGRIIHEDHLNFRRKYVDFFDVCIEGYILLKLNEGFELKYMDINLHCRLWNFIDVFLDEVELINKGLYAYLSFCQMTGINLAILEYQSSSLMNDILTVFTESYYDNYNVLISETIDHQKIMLGYQKRKSENEDIYIYKVMVVDMNVSMMVYCDYHSEIENALADYNNHFFALSFNYYQSKERENKKKINDFSYLVNHSANRKCYEDE